MCRVGMIADDLTGALDAAAPFAARGMKTIVVLSPERMAAIDPATLAGAEVICINTASRERPAEEALARVEDAATRLMRFAPELMFKKIDSRLKGHLAIETGAVGRLSGRSETVIAPAIPDLGRLVIGGSVTGAGVDRPIAIAPAFRDLSVTCPDTPDAAALDAVARILFNQSASTLAVGARGLAQALAGLFDRRQTRPAPLPLPRPALIAIGSRDPITRQQVELAMTRLAPERIEAPDGQVSDMPRGGDLWLVTTESTDRVQGSDKVARRFSQGIAGMIEAKHPASLVLSGGETAYAVLDQLDVPVLELKGEVLPGVPFTSARIAGKDTVILTKSGGFGAPDTICLLTENEVA